MSLGNPEPSEAEILKAAENLTPEESALSNAREEGYAGARSEPQRRHAEEGRQL